MQLGRGGGARRFDGIEGSLAIDPAMKFRDHSSEVIPIGPFQSTFPLNGQTGARVSEG